MNEENNCMVDSGPTAFFFATEAPVHAGLMGRGSLMLDSCIPSKQVYERGHYFSGWNYLDSVGTA